ncbi:hypothetical protein [Parendozoicomonas sp. Alg238-R29]|uniref:hypothetical protein n=1 Tax=Parendozoicomonas sp. Alg238-R29 TaxID=2993446 RepID=UPI00248DD504|nr:hypothetical protein [Parendozoicomonas sp. Alg238-R29]
MELIKWATWVPTVFWLLGCADSHQSMVIMAQQVKLTPEQHEEISSHYALLMEVQDNITRKYKINNDTQKYVLKLTNRLGNTTPMFSGLSVSGAQINLNYTLLTFSRDDEIDKDAITGLVAHELAHAQHYKLLPTLDLLNLGLRYSSYEKKSSKSAWAEWVRAYEQFTDMQVIAFGYATELIAQKRKTHSYIQEHEFGKAPFYEFSAYLTEEEIRALDENDETFNQKMEQLLKVLEWDSFREMASRFP